MADDFRLLLQTVIFEAAPRLQLISVAAERMAHQRQIEAAALLCLPDMGQFVNEEALPMQRLLGKILLPQVRMRM